MQLSELSSCNSIPDTQLKELEFANSMQATEPYGMLPSTSSTNTRKGSNALAKVQLENMECAPSKGCNRNIEILQLTPRGRNSRRRALIFPEWARETSQKVSAEGECEFWDVLCPEFAPDPFCFFFWFWGFLFLVCFGRSVALRPLWRRCSLLLCFACMHLMHA